MKKTLIATLFFVVINLPVQAQWIPKFTLGVRSGYEWNVFRNPGALSKNGEALDKDTLWASGSFQNVFLKTYLKKSWDNKKLKLGLDASGTDLNTTVDADRYTFGLKTSYRVKYAQKKYFEFAPGLQRVKRNGIDETEAILRTPFSYLRLTVPLHFDFYLGNRAWLKTQIGYTFKDYDRGMAGERLYYHAGSAALKWSKKWENKNRLAKVVLITGIDFRKYTDIRLQHTKGGQTLANQPRNWQYYRASLEYRLNLKRSVMEWTLGVYTATRKDKSNRNGYREFGPGIGWARQWNKLVLSGSARYLIRSYPGIVLENGETLAYEYIRAGIKAELALGKHLKWFVSGNLTNRGSNNPSITSLNFREYFHAFAGTGISLKF